LHKYKKQSSIHHESVNIQKFQPFPGLQGHFKCSHYGTTQYDFYKIHQDCLGISAVALLTEVRTPTGAQHSPRTGLLQYPVPVWTSSTQFKKIRHIFFRNPADRDRMTNWPIS